MKKNTFLLEDFTVVLWLMWFLLEDIGEKFILLSLCISIFLHEKCFVEWIAESVPQRDGG